MNNPANMEVLEIHAQLSATEEEAAVLHANGDAETAISVILEAIKAKGDLRESQPLWLMLFDLYRLQGRWPDYAILAKRYAATFSQPAPDWLPQELLPEGLAPELRVGGPAHCEISGMLGAGAAAQIAEIRKTSVSRPVLHIDLTKVSGVDAAGCELLAAELRRLAAGGESVMFSGGDRIESMLRRAVDEAPLQRAYWQLLLEMYRLQGDQRKFETTAMEFALFGETDPPVWEPVLMPVLPHDAMDERRDEPRYQPEVIRLEGEMTGIRDPQLAALARFGADRKYVNINTARLSRMDFVCAGNLANAVAAFRTEGKTVRILYPNHLVATLLRMLKVDDNATLVPPRSGG